MLSNLRPFLTDSPEASKSWALLSEKMPWSVKEPKLSKLEGGGLCVTTSLATKDIFLFPL